MSVMTKNGAQVNIKYQENSTLNLTGGLFAFGTNDGQKANIAISTLEGSQTSISGSIIAALGDVEIKTNGSTIIEAADIMSQSGVISIDLGSEALDPAEEYGIRGNLNASYGDRLGDSIVNVTLSGKNNFFTGTSYIDEYSSIEHNKVNIDLNEEARWNVEGIADSAGNPVNNHVSTLTLNEGIVNICYNNQPGEFKTVKAETLSGNDGLIALSLNWTDSVEENDKLLITNGEAGLHKVQVKSASSGIEAPQSSMAGFLIQVENPNESLNFTADNTRLEQGVYFKDYRLDQRTLDSGAKEWFLTYDPSSSGDLTPSAEAVVAFAGMAAQSALYQNQLSDLRARLGEVRNQNNAGIWTSVSAQREHFDSFGQIGFVQDTYRFNLGFDKTSPLCKKEHWLYIPSKDCNYYRVGFYNNILGDEKLSMYIEIGYNKDTKITKEEIDKQLDLTLKNLRESGIISDDMKLVDHETIIMDPAYVHIETETTKKIDDLKNEFSKKGVYTIGRYGAWIYNSMEDSMVKAKELAEKLR